LVLLSALLILGGLLLMLPSSELYGIITGSSTTGGFSFTSVSGTDETSAIESLLGFGLVGVGLILEMFSLFTEVGVAMPSSTSDPTEDVGKKQQ
jgi:hypothetical protein